MISNITNGGCITGLGPTIIPYHRKAVAGGTAYIWRHIPRFSPSHSSSFLIVHAYSIITLIIVLTGFSRFSGLVQ